MRQTLVLLAALLATSLASAQERLSSDQVQHAVQVVTTALGEIKDAQVKLELDSAKSTGIKGANGVGILAIPDKHLTSESLAKAGNELAPIGQLWLRNVAMFAGGKVVRGDTLRQVTVREKDTETHLQVYLVGARRTGKGLELVVFAKDKEPLLTVPLVSAEASQDLPIELAGEGERDREESAALILKLVGKYKATIPIRPAKD